MARRAGVASAALLALALLWLTGCTVPLVPGYAVTRESLAVRYVVGPPRLAVIARFELRNIGSTPLGAIDLSLPDEKIYGREGLRATIGGKQISLAPVPEWKGDSTSGVAHAELASVWRIPLEPPWPRRQALSLTIEYDLAPQPPGGARIAVNQNSFHLEPSDWFPVLRPPKKFLAPSVERPDPMPLSVFVPAAFLVRARGTPAGRNARGSEIEYRFRLRKDDLDPFVVAGAYREQQVKSADGGLIFWTFEPVDASAADTAARRIGSARAALAAAFGPLSKKPDSVWIAETPAEFPRLLEPEGQAAGRAFTGGMILNRAAFALGVASEEFADLAEGELAQSWMRTQVVPRSEADAAMGAGFARYAAIVLAESRGGAAARSAAIARTIRDYDAARGGATEKTFFASTAADSADQRRVAAAKGALFFIALEEACGEAAARRGIAHLTGALGGETVGFDELRSADELESGKNLAELYRTWLGEKGIPAEFRSHFAEGK